MRVIKAADKGIAKLWNAGKVQNAVYRLPSYSISAELENGALLLNTVTGELVFLTADEVKKLSSLPCEYAPWMDELIRKHFLVKAESDDKKTVDSMRLAMGALNASKEITSYTILPTTGCNARCFYCYEAGCKHENMTDETADALVDFMDAHRGGKPLQLHWFGGEPLLGMRQIDRISKTLTEKSIPFSSSMVSNGYLFNEETAKLAKENWKLKRIQVTLDGTEKVYNKTKAYINPCESPYKKVLDNIGFLLQNGIRVNIRLNIGLHNADDLIALVDELAERFPDQSKLRVYSHNLFDDCGLEPVHYDEEQKALLFAKKRTLDERIHQILKGIQAEPLPKLEPNRCMADDDKCLLVAPSGMLGKCENYVDSHFVGSFEDGITEAEEVKRFKERFTYPECGGCPFYPFCIWLRECPDRQLCTRFQKEEILTLTQRTMRCQYEIRMLGEKTAEEHDDEQNG